MTPIKPFYFLPVHCSRLLPSNPSSTTISSSCTFLPSHFSFYHYYYYYYYDPFDPYATTTTNNSPSRRTSPSLQRDPAAQRDFLETPLPLSLPEIDLPVPLALIIAISPTRPLERPSERNANCHECKSGHF